MLSRYSGERRRGSWLARRFIQAGSGLQWAGWLRRLRVLVPEIAFILLSAYLWYVADGFRQVGPNDLGPDFWPKLLIALLGATACVRLAQKIHAMIRRRQADSSPGSAPPQALMQEPGSVEEGNDEPVDPGKAALVIVLAVGYVLGVIYLGYPLATAIFLACFMWFAGKRNWLINVPLSIIGAMGFAYVFQKLVFVDLPTGVSIFDKFTVWLYHLVGIY